MKSRSWTLIVFDIALLAALSLAFRYQLISASFHEIAGLALLGCFFVHFFLHLRTYWHLLSRNPVARSTRSVARFIVDSLLALCALSLAISGLGISRTIGLNAAELALPLLRNDNLLFLSYLHRALGYTALLLTGIHLGLSWPHVRAKLRTVIGIPSKTRTAVARVAAVALVLAGCCGFIWLGIGEALISPFRFAVASQAKQITQTPVAEEGRHDENRVAPGLVVASSLCACGGVAVIAYFITDRKRTVSQAK